jgi:protein-S-isoprenylcysteine O-methyltransferase Ste14
MRADSHYWIHLATIAWVIFVAYWFLSAMRLKAIKKREPHRERVFYMAAMIISYVLMFNDGLSNAGWLGRRFVPEWAGLGAAGVALAFAGIGLAIWARWHLGQNWSATVSVKEGHELIRTGPYRRIRHPIYTGMLLGFAGSALALGEVRGLLALLIAGTGFFLKARKEERYLIKEFGERFQEHVRGTGMFLPKLRGEVTSGG